MAPPRSPWPIDLAHIRPFRLGDAEVRPASREVARGEQCEVLEPLVMQVLVALASARGEILSRDDLIEACWGGRVVTDDAINRVVSRLRALGRTFGTFEVETITKVGYRLISDMGVEAVRGDPRDRSAMGRRGLLAGGVAVALGLGGIGYMAWRRDSSQELPPQAEVLVQKGLTTLQNNDIVEAQDAGSIVQAVALLTEATKLAPNSPVPWGALAVAYAYLRRRSDPAERKGYEMRSRAAAKQALALDPTEHRALAALRLLEPVYRHWGEAEFASRRTLSKNPTRTILLVLHSDFLGNVGRWQEAARFTKQVDRQRYQIPGGYWRLVVDLWGSGELQAADDALADAVRQWPQNPMVWRTRAAYLMYSGRPGEVLTMMDNSAVHPAELASDYLETLRATAGALAGHNGKAAAIDLNLAYLQANPAWALQIAQAVVALGAADKAFELLDGYYFGEGAWSQLAPKGGDEDRVTKPLFQPMMSSIWRTPEFGRLLERTGLEANWRNSGTRPDYRGS